jgi:hypothetical protein
VLWLGWSFDPPLQLVKPFSWSPARFCADVKATAAISDAVTRTAVAKVARIVVSYCDYNGNHFKVTEVPVNTLAVARSRLNPHECEITREELTTVLREDADAGQFINRRAHGVHRISP